MDIIRPQISVIIPTYNRAHCLKAAIESVRNQRRVTTEIIVVDDASTDRTLELLEDLCRRMSNLRVIRHDTNKGVSAARNTGIAEARHEWVALLDSDDTWHRSKLDEQYRRMLAMRDPQNTLMFCYFYEHRGDGIKNIQNEFVRDNERNKRGEIKNFVSAEGISLEYALLEGRFWIGAGSTLFAHRDALAQNGAFEKALGYGEDTEYVFRHLVRGGDIAVVNKPLMTYLLPDRKKIYPRHEVFLERMLSYWEPIHNHWGRPTADKFAKNMKRAFQYHESIVNDWDRATNDLLQLTGPAPADVRSRPLTPAAGVAWDAAEPA